MKEYFCTRLLFVIKKKKKKAKTFAPCLQKRSTCLSREDFVGIVLGLFAIEIGK